MNQRLMNTQKGFTLMEILFVVLVIALVVSFALPAIRSVRFDVKNSQAKAALKKFAEARHSYYEASRGWNIQGSITGADAKTAAANVDCKNTPFSGIPGTAPDPVNMPFVEQLFACGMLDWKDFVGLPYTFTSCYNNSSCPTPEAGKTTYVIATGTADAGSKYTSTSGYYLYVTTADMQVEEFNAD